MMTRDQEIKRLSVLAEREPAAAADLMRHLVRRGDQGALQALSERLAGAGGYSARQVAALLLGAGHVGEWRVGEWAGPERPRWRQPQPLSGRMTPYPLRSLTGRDHLDAPATCPRALHIGGLAVPLAWSQGATERLLRDCVDAATAATAALCRPHVPALRTYEQRAGQAAPAAHALANGVLHDAIDAALGVFTDAFGADALVADQPRLYARSHALLTAHLGMQADLFAAHYLGERPLDGPLVGSPLWARLEARFFNIVQSGAAPLT